MFAKFFAIFLVLVVAVTVEAYKMHCQAQGYCVTDKSACPGFIMDDTTGCYGKLCCIEDL